MCLFFQLLYKMSNLLDFLSLINERPTNAAALPDWDY